VGQQVLNLTPRFIIDAQFDQEPALKEGLAMPIRVRLTNHSNKTLEPGSLVKLLAKNSQVELKASSATLNSLKPGESQVIEFIAIARTDANALSIPLAVTVNHPSGRRIGLIDLTREVPVINDYRITLNNSIQSLTQPGVKRVLYTIKNVSARLLYHGLQLHVRVNGANPAQNFTVIGPNPQYLFPLSPGSSEDFVVPILVQSTNPGATLELEVQEDGRPVVVHQVNF
jgi:hypothetical protein